MPPLEYQSEKYSIVSFFSGEYQNFTGASSYFGIYGLRQLETSRETPNYLAIGIKGGKIDEALDKVSWVLRRDVSLTNNFYWTIKYNHTLYKTYEIGENIFSSLINFQGFFNSSNLFYMSLGVFYRVPVYGKNYRVPFYFDGSGEEFFFLYTMGYKYFTGADAFSFDINNYNDFHIFNFNNLGFEFSFSSYFSDSWYYIATFELRTAGFLVGTGTINEERLLLGAGCNF